jgi:molecular chaperone DnaK
MGFHPARKSKFVIPKSKQNFITSGVYGMQDRSPDRLALVGLDFGMTNSILTYHKLVTGPEPYVLRGAETPAIPTVVSKESFIGNVARSMKGFIGNFKVRLPDSGLDARQRKKSADFNAASAFLDALFREFRDEQQFSGIQTLVATVPESWLSGRHQGGVDTLRDILKTIGIVEPQFLSEPVAAAAYFAYQYRLTSGMPFDGHILVYDHGGSTLDIALTQVKGSIIEVVSSLGNAGVGNGFGFGGVEFDRRVMARIANRFPKAFKGRSETQMRDWLIEFERRKREMTSVIAARCRNPDYAGIRGDRIFDVEGVEVTLADLVDVFESDFKAKIQTDLEQVISDGQVGETIDIANPGKFRVVTVGGFSQFYPIQRLLSDYFIAMSGTAETMISGINGQDRWLAVSKGACLVASDTIQINRTCPFTFGLVSYVGTEPHYHNLMVSGEPVGQYCQSRYLDVDFHLARLGGSRNARSIVLFIETAGRRTLLPMQKSFRDVLPDFGHAQTWQLGCKISNSSVMLGIKSDTGKVKSVRMGRLLGMVAGRLDEMMEP